jgi:undecaprenyl-diphosphatase
VTVGFHDTPAPAWNIGALLEDVLEKAAVVQWDDMASAWIHSRVTTGGLLVFRVLTQLGAPVLTGALSVVSCIVLLRQRRRTLALCWLAAWLGGSLLNDVLKRAVGRERPPFASAFLFRDSYSFPSGHAMGAIIVYGMLAYVIASRWRPRDVPRGVVYAIAVAVVVAIAASRLYLGVHFPTDVLGGLAAGGGWLAICLTGLHVAEGHAASRAR